LEPAEALAADARALIRYVALAAAMGLALTLGSIALLPGWIGATLAVGQGLVWVGVMLVRRRSRWLTNIVVFGLVTGVVELAADAWLVRRTGTLRYPVGPLLAASPAYMPVAWFGMLSAGIALGVALRRRFSLSIASVAVALALGVYIPLYEGLARRAGWWTYEGCAAIAGGVPLYVVLGEVLLSLPLVAITERLMRARPTTAVALGVGQGLWIFASYVLAFGAL
jgi:hypothetical protein